MPTKYYPDSLPSKFGLPGVGFGQASPPHNAILDYSKMPSSSSMRNLVRKKFPQQPQSRQSAMALQRKQSRQAPQLSYESLFSGDPMGNGSLYDYNKNPYAGAPQQVQVNRGAHPRGLTNYGTGSFFDPASGLNVMPDVSSLPQGYRFKYRYGGGIDPNAPIASNGPAIEGAPPGQHHLLGSRKTKARDVNALAKERWDKHVEDRKKRKAIGRQRQFARAQYRAASGNPNAGVMFNADNNVDMAGTMAASQAYNNPALAGQLTGLGAAIDQANQASELQRNQFDAEKAMRDAIFARQGTQYADTQQWKGKEFQAEADQRQFENNIAQGELSMRGRQYDDLARQQRAQNQLAQDKLALERSAQDWEQGDPKFQRDLQLAGIEDPNRPLTLDDQLNAVNDYQTARASDPEGARAREDSAIAVVARDPDQAAEVLARSGFGLADLYRMRREAGEDWDPNYFMPLTPEQEREQQARLDGIDAMIALHQQQEPTAPTAPKKREAVFASRPWLERTGPTIGQNIKSWWSGQ